MPANTSKPLSIGGFVLGSLSICALLVSCANGPQDKPTPQPAADSKVATADMSKNSITVALTKDLPTCDMARDGFLAYISSEKILLTCVGVAEKWDAVKLADVEAAADAASKVSQAIKDGSEAANLRLTQVDEPAGTNCKYGGKRIDSGADANKNGSLEATEIKSSVYACSDNIELAAVATFNAKVHSIGMVVVSSNITNYCGRVGENNKIARFSGTAWVLDAETLVTNAHVIDLPSTEELMAGCTNPGTATVSLSYRDISIYFPKNSLTADTLLRNGVPHYSTTSPSADDFDRLVATQFDRSPTQNPNDMADLAFLRVPSHGRAALKLSALNPANALPSSLRAGDQLFRIGYDQSSGPKLAQASLFQVQNCADFIQATGDDSCQQAGMLVNRDSYVLSFFGYGDSGGSGSPVFDRFQEVVGIMTWGANPAVMSHFISAQSIYNIRRFSDKPRVWSAIQ